MHALTIVEQDNMNMDELESRLGNIETAVDENRKVLESNAELAQVNAEKLCKLVDLLGKAVKTRYEVPTEIPTP